MGTEATTAAGGIRLRRIDAGTFLMGNDRPLPDALLTSPSCFRYGDFDERPVHRVTITRPFYLAECPITNAQYELFDPAHRALRGKRGYSGAGDEAAVYVSWHDAAAYCRWLSEREGAVFRLPTEAEWEYACRAGSATPFSGGDELPAGAARNQRRTWFPDAWRTTGENVVPLTVGRTPPNRWGIRDLHGNVEEWCLDWYGPYPDRELSDPTGPREGDFRVTRGGSHSTEPYYLRSCNRAGALPEERNWLIGFRVVRAGFPASPRTAPGAPVPLHGINVLQTTAPVAAAPVAAAPETAAPETAAPETAAPPTAGADAAPCFRGPLRYVHVPAGSYGPQFSRHNHDPAICQCPNGDLLAIWYSCVEEPGRELAILASRLRAGRAAWEPASVFWDAPDRNDHAPALFCNGRRMFHFNGISAAATWGPLRTILRTSDDSGATWSKARFINDHHGPRNMPIAAAFALRDGTLALPCDAVSVGHGGTALWLSGDGGETWRDAVGTIAGIHASAVELADGRLLAFGRGDEVDGRLAQSVSADRGKTWEYSASPFPPIRGSQRLVLTRVRGACRAGSDPLLVVSFANEPADSERAFTVPAGAGAGGREGVSGMYCAVSFDDGASWPFRRPVSDDGPDRVIEAMDGAPCVMGPRNAEVNGYLTACQSADGRIQLLSSTNHYSFNLAWLVETPPINGPLPP